VRIELDMDPTFNVLGNSNRASAVIGDAVRTYDTSGMTFEKHSGDPISVRLNEQYVAQWTSLFQAGLNKERILTEWHDAWVDALAQGLSGLFRRKRIDEHR